MTVGNAIYGLLRPNTMINNKGVVSITADDTGTGTIDIGPR